MSEIQTLYSCKRAVLRINGETGHVALWKNPDSFYPTQQIELHSVAIEHYPEDHTIGIYGIRTIYFHKSDIAKKQSLLDKICSKYVETKTTQNLFRWTLRKQPKSRRVLIERDGPWFLSKELRDFRLIIQEKMLSIIEGANPADGHLYI